MTRAYVLITTDVNATEAVQARLRELPGVRSADIVTGDYDLIVLIEASSTQDIGRLVLGPIRGIDGIAETTTAIVVG